MIAARPRRPRRRWPRVVLALVAAGALFLLGVGLGITLEEAPEPGPAQTSVRTLDPRPLTRGATTVTVTVTAP